MPASEDKIRCPACGELNALGSNRCKRCGFDLINGETEVVCKSCGDVNPVGEKFCRKCGAELSVEHEQRVSEDTSRDNTVGNAADVPSATDARQNTPPQDAYKNADRGYGNNYNGNYNYNYGYGNGYNNNNGNYNYNYNYGYGNNGYNNNGYNNNYVPPAPTPSAPADDAPPFLDNPVGVRQKVVAFEYKRNLIGNLFLMIMALVMALMSFLTPINVKYRLSNAAFSEPEMYESDTYITVGQSIFNVFGAISYLNEVTYNDGEKICGSLQEDFAAAFDAARQDYEDWLNAHPEASGKETYDAYADFVGQRLSDMNYIAYTLIFEGDSDDVMYDYSDNVLHAIYLFSITIMAIALGIVSTVNFIIGLVGVCAKKKSKNVFSFLSCATALSGVQLVITLIAPGIVAVGGAFATMLTAALAFLISGTVTSIFRGKACTGKVVKNAVVSALMLIAFFLLCGNTVTVSAIMSSGDVRDIYGSSSMLPEHMYNLMSSGEITSTAAAMSGAIATLCINVAILLSMIGVVKQLSYNALLHEKIKASSGSPLALASLILLIVAVIFCSVGLSNGVKSLAYITGGNIEVPITFMLRFPAFVSMALSLGAFIFDRAYNPDKKTAARV